VLAANLETAINGVWDAGVQPGDRVTVIGAGTVGSLVAYIAGRIPQCDVELVDVNASRARIARAFGVHFAIPATARSDRDVVIHVSGSPSGLQRALEIAGFEAAIVEMSWYGDLAVGVPLGEAFHARRLTIKSSQVGSVAASQRARWDSQRRMQLALAMLADPALDVLITGESRFEDLPEVMARIATNPADTIFHRVRYA
jgi:threonine dehydrogenase-like Zn-dependent dehydrogenase